MRSHGKPGAARLILGAVVGLLAVGCTAVITAPVSVSDPVPVYVLDHGRHNSLVLVVEGERALRLAYGEWGWYVEGRTGPLRTLSTLFRPTPGALGRGELRGPLEPACWQAEVGSKIRAVLGFSAERAEVRALATSIEQRFDTADPPPSVSLRLNLEFIVAEQPYTLAYNSNHRVVEWLEMLGFEVRGDPTLGRLRAADPAHVVVLDGISCAPGVGSASQNRQPSITE
ncbi:MAG: hypothetical protein JJT93_00910 [Gammaproteobacteria bacterium]|nr:hypothetical protein [Gammaproteobacteria bacterium]